MVDGVIPPISITVPSPSTTTRAPPSTTSTTPTTPRTQWDCNPIPGRSDFSCVFETTPFPITSEPSFLFVRCTTQFPTNPLEECSTTCGVFLGTPSRPLQADICARCIIFAGASGSWNLEYDCRNRLTGTCVGRSREGACIDNTNDGDSNCEDDRSARFALSDDETGGCDDIDPIYKYLCDFTDVALSCPQTCGTCSSVTASGSCNDMPGAVSLASAPSGLLSCSFLRANIGRFQYACGLASVAFLCPSTCGTNGCVSLFEGGGRKLEGDDGGRNLRGVS